MGKLNVYGADMVYELISLSSSHDDLRSFVLRLLVHLSLFPKQNPLIYMSYKIIAYRLIHKAPTLKVGLLGAYE